MTFLDRQCFVELPLTELSEALVNRDMGSRELARDYCYLGDSVFSVR